MMVLRWAKLKYGDVAEFTYEEIKSILGCLEDGTPLENVERLNEHARIRKHVYRPQFRYSWATGTTFIWEEIGERRPVIAYVLRKHLDSSLIHAVVITGHSDDRTTIYINDPLDDRASEVPTGRFIHEWELLYRTVARVMIVESRDTRISDFEDGNDER